MLHCNYLLVNCGLILKYMDAILEPYPMAFTAVHGSDFLTLPASSQPSLSKLKSNLLLLFPDWVTRCGYLLAHWTSVLLGPATIYRCVELSFCVNTRLCLLTCISEVSVCSQTDFSVAALTYRVNLLPNSSQCIVSASCINHVLILTHFSTRLNIWSSFLPCRK